MDRSPTQEQIRFLKCVPPESQMYPEARTSADISDRWNALQGGQTWWGKLTPGAAGSRLLRLERRGFVARMVEDGKTLWELTVKGRGVVDASTL